MSTIQLSYFSFSKVLLPKRMISSAHPFQGRSVFPFVPSYASIHLSTFNIIDILVLKEGLTQAMILQLAVNSNSVSRQQTQPSHYSPTTGTCAGTTLLHQDWPFTPFGSQGGSLPGLCASTQHGNMPESLWRQWNHTGDKAPLQKGLRWASGVPGKAQNPLKECGKKRTWLTTPAMRVNKKNPAHSSSAEMSVKWSERVKNLVA